MIKISSEMKIDVLILGIFLLVGGVFTAIGVIVLIPLIPEFTLDKLVSSKTFMFSFLSSIILMAIGIGFIIVTIYVAQIIKKQKSNL